MPKAEAAETALACDQTLRVLDNINNTELQNSIKDYVEEEKKERKHEKPHAKKLRKKKRRARVAAILLKRKRVGAAGYSTATSRPSGPQGGAPAWWCSWACSSPAPTGPPSSSPR